MALSVSSSFEIMEKLNEHIKVEIIKSLRNPDNHVAVSMFFCKIFFRISNPKSKVFRSKQIIKLQRERKKTHIFHPKL